MTQEDRQLLLADLFARFHCRVKVIRYIERNNKIEQLIPVLDLNLKLLELYISNQEFIIKPYLRSMSLMTEEERHELEEIMGSDIEISDDFINIVDSSRKRFSFLELQAVFAWLNKKMFDYMGLIPKGLALEAPKDMYKEKE